MLLIDHYWLEIAMCLHLFQRCKHDALNRLTTFDVSAILFELGCFELLKSEKF